MKSGDYSIDPLGITYGKVVKHLKEDFKGLL